MIARMLLLSILVIIATTLGGGSERGVMAALPNIHPDYVPEPPWMGGFADIWVDDTDNLVPAIAYNSHHDEYLVVWENDRGATRDIYARRVGGDGSLKSWFTIVHDPNIWNWQPDVAYNPILDEYLVVYSYKASNDDYDIWARRVSWNGGWMSPEFAISTEPGRQWQPSVAFNSQRNEYLVVYENYWSNSFRDIAAQRVRGTDGYLLSWRNIATGANQVRRLPDVAYLEPQNEYLIAYTHYVATDDDIYGRTANFNLSTLSAEQPMGASVYSDNDVSLVAVPGEYMAVWEVDKGNASAIYGARYLPSGQRISNFIPLLETNNIHYVEPDIARDSYFGYVVVARRVSINQYGNNIYGRFLQPGHDNPSGPIFVLDGGWDSQRSPVVACAGLGRCYLAEEDNYPGGDYEIRGRMLGSLHTYTPIFLKRAR